MIFHKSDIKLIKLFELIQLIQFTLVNVKQNIN